MAASAGLLPTAEDVALLQLPAPQACSDWRWTGAVADDGAGLWLHANDRWWRLDHRGVANGSCVTGRAAVDAAAEVAANWPGGAPPWLFAEDALAEVWLRDQPHSGVSRVVSRLPATDGRAALRLLESMWLSRRLQPLDDHIQAAVAASSGAAPNAVLEWDQGQLTGLGAHLEQPDNRTAHMVARRSPRRDQLSSLLAFRDPVALDLLAHADSASARIWTRLA